MADQLAPRRVRGPADAWREAYVTLADQLADDVAAWGEMHPEPWEVFLEVAETVREMVEVYGEEDDQADQGDHLVLLEYLALRR